MNEDIFRRVTARIFKTGTSQAVRLPKEFGFDTDTVLPTGYVESFSDAPDDFDRPPQGTVEKRRKL